MGAAATTNLCPAAFLTLLSLDTNWKMIELPKDVV